VATFKDLIMARTPAQTPAAEPASVTPLDRQATDIAANSAARQVLLSTLRQRILRLEGDMPDLAADRDRTAPVSPWLLGLEALDARLPVDGLDAAGIHEIAPREPGDVAAAMGFAAALGVRRLLSPGTEGRPLLWCRLARMGMEAGGLYGPGLNAVGLPAARIVTAALGKQQAILWTADEALKSGALSGVILDLDPAKCTVTAMRRLQLAAQAGQTPAIIVMAHASALPSAARSRWAVASLPSLPPPLDERAPGKPAWHIELRRCRRGKPGNFSVEWDHATHRFSLVAAVSGGAADAGAAESRGAAAAAGSSLRLGHGRG
jgi:protein ImuA